MQTAACCPATHLPLTSPPLSASQNRLSPATPPASTPVPTEQLPPARAALGGCCHLPWGSGQAEHRVAMVPEALGGGKKLVLHLSKDNFCMSERSCVWTTSLSLSQGGFVSQRTVECHTASGAGTLQCPGKAAPLAPAALPQSLSSEDKQVTHPPRAVAPLSLAGAKYPT